MNAKERELDLLLTPDALRGGDDDEGPKPQEKAKPRKDDLTEVDRLLTPSGLREKPDPLAGTLGELVPDELRGGEDQADELPAAKQTPAVQTPVVNEVKISLGEWAEKWAKDQAEKTKSDELEREIERRKVEDENLEIRKSFERVIAAKDAARTTADLTPGHYKDQE